MGKNRKRHQKKLYLRQCNNKNNLLLLHTMEVINATDHVCNWTSPLCPHYVYNFTNTTEKAKVEGSQSRFLGGILGMDPLSVLHKIQYRNSTGEINRYRTEVNVKDVVEMIEFLHVLKIIWEEDDIPCFYMGQPLDPTKFQKFAERIEVEHKKKNDMYCGLH